MMRLPALIRAFLVMAATALVVSACSSSGEEARACPSVSFVDGLDEMRMFDRRGATEEANMVYGAKLARLQAKCRLARDGARVEAEFLMLAVKGQATGATGADEIARLSYFVAVTDAQNRIVTKQIFETKFPLSEARPRLAREETVRPFLPAGEGQDLAGWRVLIGFQLTPEQAAYNRALHR